MDTTLMKGLRLLERLVQSDAPMGVSALAEELDLQKSNVHRTLATLVKLGYVQQNGSGRYRPTRRIWEQGTRVIRRDPVRRAALSFMHALHQQTAETVTLVVLDGDDCLYLHQIAAPVPVRPTSTVGHRVPPILTAAGKALLAFQPDSEKRARAICKRQSRSGRARVKIDALLAELAAIRKSGCAFSMSAWREGIHSVASAVLDADEHALAAISVSGPSERMSKERMKGLCHPILNACTQVRYVLGAS